METGRRCDNTHSSRDKGSEPEKRGESERSFLHSDGFDRLRRHSLLAVVLKDNPLHTEAKDRSDSLKSRPGKPSDRLRQRMQTEFPTHGSGGDGSSYAERIGDVERRARDVLLDEILLLDTPVEAYFSQKKAEEKSGEKAGEMGGGLTWRGPRRRARR